MISLRPYQIEVIEQIKETFHDHKRQYVEMPTGSGKTITFLSYCSQNYKKVLVIVPSKELLNQVYESGLLFYHKSEISRKGNNFNEKPKKLHICIINSIREDYIKFISQQHFDLVIIDEAHHSQAESYQRLIKNMSFSTRFLGVTATPDRSDGLLLKNTLNICSAKLHVFDLINQGYLSDIEGYSIKTKIDINDIDSHNGDFSINQLYKKLCINSRNNLILDLCKTEMLERKTLIFCINVEHSKQINKLLSENGLSSKHIDGSNNAVIRKAILSAFQSGEIQFITNCQLLTEGFDEPSINGIILARPTRSRALYNQMIGRGLRISPGKQNCKIIDIVDNHKSLRSFNCILKDAKFPEMTSFKSIKDIRSHLNNEAYKILACEIQRADLINQSDYELEPTDSMLEYLTENNILHYSPTFDEASFMIWFNEMKKEYANGNY